MVDAVNPPDVWPPFGAFSMAVIQGNGQIVHLKGQVSLDRQGEVVGHNDMRAQVRKALENVGDVLGAMSGQMADVVSLVHYATDIGAFMSTGDIRMDFFALPYPCYHDGSDRASIPSRIDDRNCGSCRNSPLTVPAPPRAGLTRCDRH